MHNIVIQQLYTLHNVNHVKCSYHLSTNNVITKSMTIVSMMYFFINPCNFFYIITANLYLLIPYNCCVYPQILFENHQFVLCISVSVSAFVCKFVFVFYIPHMGEILWCFSVLITLLCIIPYRSIRVFANVKMPFFLWLRNIPLYICTPPLHNSSIGGIAQVADMTWLSYMTL